MKHQTHAHFFPSKITNMPFFPVNFPTFSPPFLVGRGGPGMIFLLPGQGGGGSGHQTGQWLTRSPGELQKWLEVWVWKLEATLYDLSNHYNPLKFDII